MKLKRSVRSKIPKLPYWLLRKLACHSLPEGYAGDIEEEFEERVRYLGKRKTVVWIWVHALAALPKAAKYELIWGATMLKNYLKIAFRNLVKHKGYALINISGLTIGILSSLMILLVIRYELSYDRHSANSRDIYRIVTRQPIEFMNTNKFTWTSALLAPALKDHFADVSRASRIEEYIDLASLSRGNRVFSEKAFYFVDPDFLSMFSVSFRSGNPATALNEPLSVIISADAARKYFAGENPLGQKLRFNDKFDFLVTGVFENVPKNSHFRYDFLASFRSLWPLAGENAKYIDNWGSLDYQTYIQLKKKTDPGEFEKALGKYLVANTPEYQKENKYFLQPLTKIHLGGNILGELAQNSSVTYVAILAGIAVLVILITCFNYVNLSTARFSARAKEIHVRKVVGAGRMQLIRQFMGETFLITSISSILALILLSLILPSLRTLIRTELDFAFLLNIRVLASVAVFSFVFGLIAGYFPALILSSRKRLEGFRAGMAADGGRSGVSRNVLVVAQFVISTALIVSAMTVRGQVEFIMKTNLGRLNDPVITILVNEDNAQIGAQAEVFARDLKRNPAIRGVSFSSFLPTNIRAGNFAFWEGQKQGEKFLFHNLRTDYGFLDLYGIPIVRGRNFSREFPSDSKEAYLVNETAVRMMGLRNPIGKRFGYRGSAGQIIGVVQDFHFVPMHQRIQPLAIRLDPHEMRHISIKIDSSRMDEAIRFIESQWKGISPGFAFTYKFIDAAVDELYQSERRLSRIITVFTWTALFLANLGLFGLTLFSVERRVKEIGVRKVLGAKTTNIMVLLTRDFFRWILGANLLALPLAYLAMNQWLRSFAYRTHIAAGIFVLAALLSFAAAGLTVAYQTVRVAAANPVESLRHE